MAIFNSTSPDLEADGPIVDVTLSPRSEAIDAMVEAGETAPAPVAASALIDTGASGTAVRVGLLSSLGLHPVGSVPVSTPTDTNVQCNLYAVQLNFPYGSLDVTVVEAPLQGQNIQVLIGRDVLKHAVLIMQGPSNQFTISF